jgi:Rps23 Pro-64 3,4-dihydroxylase Tpa1-like proline 4-hydroxylase
MLNDISSALLERHPFDHFLIKTAVDNKFQSVCLDWLESEAPWSLTETNFYEQYEFSLLECELPPQIASLTSRSTLDTFRFLLSKMFGLSFSKNVEVVAHKLVNSQTIKIHNDYILGAETHRVLIQLNRGWSEKNGGYLMLFAGQNPESLCKIIPPESGSIQGFAISSHSYHAVSTVHDGERFTIVYSFVSASES